jgi:alpha/beta superfamily hydrolase
VNTTLRTGDGNTIEAIIEAPTLVTGTVVLCHPHPLHGGTMRAPLLIAVEADAIEAGYRVIRFNFRGVGESTGEFGNGIDEMEDITAAMALASEFREPVRGICGWSFGAATALRWQAHTRSSVPYVGIAPPISSPLAPSLPDPASLVSARRRFIIGERDQFIDTAELSAYAESIDAAFLEYAATDHFFVFRYERLATDVVDGFGS